MREVRSLPCVLPCVRGIRLLPRCLVSVQNLKSSIFFVLNCFNQDIFSRRRFPLAGVRPPPFYLVCLPPSYRRPFSHSRPPRLLFALCLSPSLAPSCWHPSPRSHRRRFSLLSLAFIPTLLPLISCLSLPLSPASILSSLLFMPTPLLPAFISFFVHVPLLTVVCCFSRWYSASCSLADSNSFD